jgi:hypothetical protein
LFSGGTLLKSEFSTNLQAVGVNATAYAAKRAGTRQARTARHNPDENRLAQAGQVLRHCALCNGITSDGDLIDSRNSQVRGDHFICGPV